MSIANRRIFLVEDDPVQSKAYSKLIEDCGFEVQHFSSAKECLATRHEQERPDCILSDIQTPEVSGLEFMKQLQTDPEWCLVPSILMTSDPSRDQLVFAKKLKIPPESFLVKPVGRAALREILTTVLEDRKPLYKLRGLQRERLAMELAMSTEDKKLASEQSEVENARASASREITNQQAIIQLARNAEELDEAGQESIKEAGARISELRVELRNAEDRNAEIVKARRRLEINLDRELKLVDAQIKTAYEVTRHMAA